MEVDEITIADQLGTQAAAKSARPGATEVESIGTQMKVCL